MDRKLLTDFKEALRVQGLSPAMRLLNDATKYRFSAVYAFLGGNLRNVCLIDKTDAQVSRSGDLPVDDSYCVFVRRYAQPFSVENSLRDSRVENHPKQRSIHSYYGVPIVEPGTARVIGTVCHFDYESMKLAVGAADILDEVAPLIAEELAAEINRWNTSAVDR